MNRVCARACQRMFAGSCPFRWLLDERSALAPGSVLDQCRDCRAGSTLPVDEVEDGDLDRRSPDSIQGRAGIGSG